MNILVTGGNGQLASCIAELCYADKENKYIFLGKDELDITNRESIANAFEKHNPHAVVNCAAFVKTDDAESRNQLLAYKVNTLGPTLLAEECKKKDAELIHISTDYVFDGEKPTAYSVSDECNPLNIYGITKYCGEQAILNIYPENSIIIRTSWLYSEYGDNFFTKTVKNIDKAAKEGRGVLNYVVDQIGCPTYAMNLAAFIVKDLFALQKDVYVKKNVIFHYTDDGIASRYDFAHAINELVYKEESKVEICSCESSQFVDKAKRPKCCILSKQELKEQFKCEIHDWRTSLELCAKRYNDKLADALKYQQV